MRGIYVRAFAVIVLIFSVNAAFAQRSSGLAVEGKISVEDGSPEGAIISDAPRRPSFG